MQQSEQPPLGDLLREPLPCPQGGGVSQIQAAPELEEIPRIIGVFKTCLCKCGAVGPAVGPGVISNWA